ncbi:MAG TPA: uroporphyrinogen-III synthase [Acinetobacter lwoffii]|uniref:Uroporphyrinogen-III synthase n=2 Tax=Acinetobacter TaxID=469 RepID=A0A9D2ZYR9_ACILW|nr:uroporphyrinogen-III synthase [Acinetobacter lwoffii]
MLFINTRPRDRAAKLTEQLQNAQIPVVELPLLELIAQPLSEGLLALYRRLDQADIIVVVSPTAVQLGMRYLQQAGVALHSLQHVQWVAVGQATEKALAAYGIHSHVPELETSEGMLQLPVLKQLALPATVAFWRGEGGRQFMMQHLHEQKVQVLNFVLYRRQCPAESADILEKKRAVIQAEQPCVVLISSEASWLNWLDLAEKSCPQLIHQAHYLVLGPRLAVLLGEYQQQHQAGFQFAQLDDLSGSTILHYMLTTLGHS